MTDPADPARADVLEEILRQEDKWDAPVAARWSRFVKVFLACAAVFLLGGAALNVAVNPRGEFEGGLLPPVPSEDAAYKVHLLGAQHPDVLVLGSSRMQKIDPKEIAAASNLTAFNFSLAGTNPDDSRFVYDKLVARGVVPKEIVVGLDVNRVEPHPRDSNRTQYAFGPLHDPGASWADAVAAGARSYQFLYLRDSAVSVADALGVPVPHVHDVTFEPDGLAHYVPWETAVAAGTFDRNATIAKTIGAGGYHAFAGLDPAEVAAIQGLVADARAHGATVRLLLTPIAHRVEAGYEARGGSGYPQARAAVVALARSLCQPGVHAYNYTRTEAFGGDEAGFYDGIHYDAGNAARIVASAYAGRADLCA